MGLDQIRSFLRTSYQRILPPTVRAKVWCLRKRLRDLPTESQNLRRHLSFRLSGRCTVCRGRNLVKYTNPTVARLRFRFYTCQDCGFIFVLAPPDLASVYAAHAIPDLGDEVWNGHYLDCINKRAHSKGKLLEIGFGAGGFLKLAYDDGWTTYGTDLSEPVVKHAREELNLPNISLGTIEEVGYENDVFDVVAGFNFLEHVPDARNLLLEIRRILRPCGVLAIMCPNIAGIYHSLMPDILSDNDPLQISWVPPEHVGYFNKTNLRMLLESVGFAGIEDASHLMSTLWQQFEPDIGPKATDQRLEALISQIKVSKLPKGDARVVEYRERIRRLIVERMTWTMLADFMKLEPALGAEVGVLLLAQKPEGARN
jgi:SAM-dependent methyltransferase